MVDDATLDLIRKTLGGGLGTQLLNFNQVFKGFSDSMGMPNLPLLNSSQDQRGGGDPGTNASGNESGLDSNPNAVSAVNALGAMIGNTMMSMVSPVPGVASMVGHQVGLPSTFSALMSLVDSISNPNGVASASPTAHGFSPAQDSQAAFEAMDAGSDGDSGAATGDTGTGVGAGAGADGGPGDSGGGAYHKGGLIPGTGTKPIIAKGGEFVIPENVVRAKGTDFFEALLEKYSPENVLAEAMSSTMKGT